MAAAQPPGLEAGDDPLMELLADIWCELMDLPEVGPDDDFFDLGGQSMQAAMVTQRIRDELRVELPVRAVFENPTLAELAYEIRRRNPELDED